MKVLILGGTGFISRNIVKLLLGRGHSVTIFNRGKSGDHFTTDKRISFITGNRNSENDLKDAARECNFDVVYDMIAYRAEQTEMAVKAFNNKTGRFIHCSTISVYMVSDKITLPVTENQHASPLMEYQKRNPFGMQYGIDKRLCEEVLWKYHSPTSFPVTIIRPTFVSGPGDPAARDYFWIQRILDGKPLLVPGKGNFIFQQVYVMDCAEIFCRAIESAAAAGEAYNAAAEEKFTLNQYLEKLAGLMGRESELVHLDQEEFDKLGISYSPRGDVFPFNTKRNAEFSLVKVKQHLGYKSTPFEFWMSKTIDWFTREYAYPSVGYENRDEEIRIINSLKKRKRYE